MKNKNLTNFSHIKTRRHPNKTSILGMQVKCFLFLATSLSALQMYACHLDGSQEQYTSLRLARAEPANILRHDVSKQYLGGDNKIRLDHSKCSLTARVSSKLSLLSYYTGFCAVIALADFLLWSVSKFNARDTAILSDRLFSLQSWSGKENILEFIARMILYSLGHGNLFHFLGKESPTFLQKLDCPILNFTKQNIVEGNLIVLATIGPRIEGKKN